MMALSDDERKTLEALQAKESEPDTDDFDIEIWDETGAGARVPYRKGRSWLNRFGIDLPEEPPAEGDQDQAPAKPRSKGPARQSRGNVAEGYFGSKKSS